jgi:cytochrome P450
MEREIPQFPMPRTDPLLPPPELMQLVKERPVAQVRLSDGKIAWLVTRHADVRAMLVDPRISADASQPEFPPIGPSGANPDLRTFPRRDPPEHTIGRRMLAAEFAPDRVEALRPKTRRIIAGLLDAMLARHPPVDLMECLALPLPTLLICDLLGVPYEDHAVFQRFEAAVMSLDREESARGAKEEIEYLDRLIDGKLRVRSQDLIGRLITEQVQTGAMSRAELLRVVRTLLSAGHESTANMIGLSALSLMLDSDALRYLRSHPDKIGNATYELLRFHTIFHLFAPRVAKEDVVVGDTTIPAGSGVILSLLAANHDPSVFPDPGRLDLSRDARTQVALGFGAHHCLGQGLARMELEEAIPALFERTPTLRLAVPMENLRFRTDRATYGVHSLPVVW